MAEFDDDVVTRENLVTTVVFRRLMGDNGTNATSNSSPGQGPNVGAHVGMFAGLVGSDVDIALHWAGRICTALVILALLFLCIGWPLIKKRMLPSRPTDGRRYYGFRWHKVKKCLYNLFCCGLCCHRVYKQVGFDPLEVGSALRVTLIRAQQITRSLDLYFEVWSEPVEGYPKNSRIHQQAGGSCSLGNEQLELDWYGDEEEVVFHAVQFRTAGQQSGDVPIGELRIKRDAVERYASEAAETGPQDITKGARLFAFRELSQKEARRRELRFKQPMDPMVPMLMSKITQGGGYEVPNMLEHERLLQENEALRTEIQRQGGSRSVVGFAGTRTGEASEVLMQVAIRFEILEKPSAQVPSIAEFRSPSFEVDPGSAFSDGLGPRFADPSRP